MKVNLFVFVLAINIDFQFCIMNVVIDSKNELHNKYFQISQDQMKVEEMVVAYAKSRKNLNIIRSKITAQVRLLWNTNICHQSKEVKIAFCAELLQIDYYGFEFDVKKSKNFYCEFRSFEIKSTIMTKAYNFPLPMFRCPYIFYTDLETNKKVYWQYQYRVSKAKKHDSAFIFFQKTFHSTIYPQKYASNISFKGLKDQFQKDNDNLWDQPSDKYFNGFQVEQKTVEYLNARQICNPYRKFVQLFFSINVCSLRRSHKIYICHAVMKKSVAKLKVDMEDSDEVRCKKYNLKFHYDIKQNLQKNNKIYALHCLLSQLEKADRLVEYSHLYIASSIDWNFVTIYSRRNEPRELLSPIIYTNLLKTFLLLIKDIRRTKLLPYLKIPRQFIIHNESVVEMEKKLGSELEKAKILVKSPLKKVLNYAAPLFQLINKSKLLEDTIILFSKIKSTKLVYQKFMNLHGSLNICQLSTSQMYKLCKSILEALKNQLRNEVLVNTNPSPCSRIKITLHLREVENLGSKFFALRQCSIYSDFASEDYYVIKIHKKNSMAVFASSELFQDLYTAAKRNQQPKLFPYAILIKI